MYQRTLEAFVVMACFGVGITTVAAQSLSCNGQQACLVTPSLRPCPGMPDPSGYAITFAIDNNGQRATANGKYFNVEVSNTTYRVSRNEGGEVQTKETFTIDRYTGTLKGHWIPRSDEPLMMVYQGTCTLLKDRKF